MDVKINFQTVAPFTSSVIIIDCAFGMYNHIFVIHGLCSIANIYNILMRVEGLNINNNGKVQKNLKKTKHRTLRLHRFVLHLKYSQIVC